MSKNSNNTCAREGNLSITQGKLGIQIHLSHILRCPEYLLRLKDGKRCGGLDPRDPRTFGGRKEEGVMKSGQYHNPQPSPSKKMLRTRASPISQGGIAM